MFCPNCGNDCKDAKFCVKCGTKIQSEEDAQSSNAVWSVGMPCPHCGGTKLDGNNCAFCGAQLLKAERFEKEKSVLEIDSYEIPIGRYQYFSNSIFLEEECFVIYKKKFFIAVKERVLYKDLTAMMYVRPADAAFAPGYLVFRWKGNNDPLPTRECCANDKASIKFSAAQDYLFYHLFCFVKSQGPSSAQVVMENIAIDSEEVSKMVDQYNLDTYFERFNPYRERAVQALCDETSLSEHEAKSIVNSMFDMYQERLYRTAPHAAVRDANRAIKEHRRLVAERQKENQSQWEKERMMYQFNRKE